MKTLSITLLMSVGLAAPAFADPVSKTAAAPVQAVADHANANPDADENPELLGEATTPAERRRQLMRCGGPPAPRDHEVAARVTADRPTPPMSEPAAVEPVRASFK
jgi:hypothetical protein